jgi:hypothetical protein
MNCAVRISLINSVCPLCRGRFTHVLQSGNPWSQYDVSIHSFPTELPPSSPIIMSIAVNLIFDENGRGGYDVLLPEYIECIDDMDNAICRIQPRVDINSVIKDVPFANMITLVDRFKDRPLIFIKILIAQCVMEMVDDFQIFVIHKFLIDPREDEGGSNMFLLSTS